MQQRHRGVLLCVLMQNLEMIDLSFLLGPKWYESDLAAA